MPNDENINLCMVSKIDKNIINLLIERSRPGVDFQHALMLAADHCKADAIEVVLLNKYNEINQQTLNEALLSISRGWGCGNVVKASQLMAVELLLGYGADPNFKDPTGSTPTLESRNNDYDMFQIMLQYGGSFAPNRYLR